MYGSNQNKGDQQQQQQYSNFQSQEINQQSPQWNVNDRLNMIEKNLGRVASQYDMLMPFVEILEKIKDFDKIHKNISILSKGQAKTEQKLKQLESSIKANENPKVFETITYNFSQQKSETNRVKNRQKELEEMLKQQQQYLESKQKEQAQHVYNQVQGKLEKNKKDIQNILADFKNTLQIEQKKSEELQNMLKNPSVILPNNNNINNANQQDDQNNPDYQNNLQNVYRELGMLRCEIELLYDKDRRNTIYAAIEQEPQLSDTNQKQLVVTNHDQAIFFDEIERFDRENQERVVYELHCLDEKLGVIQTAAITPQSEQSPQLMEELRQEMTYIEDRFWALKSQIKGTKKKYLVDGRKLEDKLENLNRMKEHIEQNQTSGFQNRAQQEHLQKHMILINSYPERLNRLNQNIVDHVEELQVKFRQIEEKLHQINKNIVK